MHSHTHTERERDQALNSLTRLLERALQAELISWLPHIVLIADPCDVLHVVRVRVGAQMSYIHTEIRDTRTRTHTHLQRTKYCNLKIANIDCQHAQRERERGRQEPVRGADRVRGSFGAAADAAHCHAPPTWR